MWNKYSQGVILIPIRSYFCKWFIGIKHHHTKFIKMFDAKPCTHTLVNKVRDRMTMRFVLVFGILKFYILNFKVC